MRLVQQMMEQFDVILLWGLVATIVMTTLLQGSQQIGWSRLSLPFLLGTCITERRPWATVLGYIFYTIGGWLIAFLYFALFSAIGRADVWIGALVGFVHSAFLLIVFLPVLSYLHPRMASEYSGPDSLRKLEPPGSIGLHYGRPTPVITLIGQTLYGAILGAGFGS